MEVLMLVALVLLAALSAAGLGVVDSRLPDADRATRWWPAHPRG